MEAQQQVFKLGKSTVVTYDDKFADGYANGIVTHPDGDQEQPLTVEAIDTIIAKSLSDHHHARAWNIGYIVGAISGIREGNRRNEPDGSEVQLGSVTLRLNYWRFREGYLNGQMDYEEGQHERTSTTVLTARDLLRYIAHHDPEANRYYFGEEELATLEETLGQLVGYLCATLFPKQEPTTEPLQHSAVLQQT